MPGLLSYDYGDVKSGKIKLRSDGTMVPQNSAEVIVLRTGPLVDYITNETPFEIPDDAKARIASCFALDESGRTMLMPVKELVIYLDEATSDNKSTLRACHVYQVTQANERQRTYCIMRDIANTFEVDFGINPKTFNVTSMLIKNVTA